MVKLAEIDAMMMDSGDSDSSDDINITQINDDLIAANSEDETVIADANDYNLNDTENSSIEEEVVDEIQVPEIQSPEVQAPVLNNNINSDVLRDHEMIKGHHSDELMRLGETIKNLQDDREQLLSRVKDLEELQGTKERNSISVKAELDEKKIEISILRKRYVQQIEDMKVQLEISNEKKEILSEKNKQFESEYENLRRKIRVDLNKVKSRENELEGKLEMLRSDADIQIRNRDQKILELKRKIDTLEFDNESIQTKGQKIVNNKYELEGKMEKVIQTLRSAIGELEDDTALARTIKDVKKNLDV
jgi:chromosome segregation ATPase